MNIFFKGKKYILELLFIIIILYVNIYIFYWTSWLENNQLQFREDIYTLDKELFEKLRSD